MNVTFLAFSFACWTVTENSFAALRKKMADKSRFGLGLNQQGRVFDKNDSSWARWI